MQPTRKIAMVAPQWGRWLHRLLAGALQYANAHPHIVIRPFTTFGNCASVVQELERWGAAGILGGFQEEELRETRQALSKPIPIVNCFAVGPHPGVVSLVSDASLFLERAVDHLRHLGIRNFGVLFTEHVPDAEVRVLQPFRRLTQPNTSSLIVPVDRTKLMDPESDILPVPTELAEWLRKLPKPSGVLCMALGSGPYLIRCCTALGLKVPGDIAVVGSDDTDLSLSCIPTLTSIVPGIEEVGMEAVRLLVGMADGAAAPDPYVRLKAFDLVVRESTGQRRPTHCDIAGALGYIEKNATKGITVGQLMRETQEVSAPTFHQSFRAATGKSPAQAIRERQMEEVRRLLKTTELPMSMISELSGFSSTNVMTRQFQRTEGMPPRAYRKSRGRREG
jgi:LacI family transcriptional regulator